MSATNISNREEVGYSERLRAGVGAGAYADAQNNGKMSHVVWHKSELRTSITRRPCAKQHGGGPSRELDVNLPQIVYFTPSLSDAMYFKRLFSYF